MSRYECCYTSGRQFVFYERSRWPLTWQHVTVSLGGFVLGLSLYFFISLAGVAAFEAAMVGIGFLAARSAYRFSFHGYCHSVDVSGYVVMIVAWSWVLVVFLSVVRLLLTVDLSTEKRCMLFSACIMVMGFLTYTYLSLACCEDERKHQLCLCSSEGHTLGGVEIAHREELTDDGWNVYARFLEWIITWRWWIDVQDFAPSAEEYKPGGVITVHNHTLKLIKVCFYSPEDVFCWVPFGGISGRCVGLVSAGNRRSFRLPVQGNGSKEATGLYRLKVFQPCLLDKELACFSKAQPGQNFAFFDVEGMVRHSRALSAPRSLPLKRPSYSESSEDEASAPSTPKTVSTMSLPSCILSPSDRLTPLQARSGSQKDLQFLRQNSRGNGLAKRPLGNCDNLQKLALEAQSSDEHPVSPTSEIQRTSPTRASARRAGLDEVVVRNRSSQEICARLFRSNDFCYLLPIVGKLTACGDCILPDAERRFNPTSTSDRDFTLKVYSVGAGARELTYLTVSRGHTYTFCDSLLS